MKKIVFKKIKLENFLSFGSDPTELEFKSGVTFVTGTNFDKNSKNGVGKTALIIESLSYALFGETYRKILVENIANWKNKDTCIVQLWFSVNDDEYHVTRSTNPSKLFLKKNGKDIQKTIPETEKDILEILGISKDIFTNTLVMTNRSDTFLSLRYFQSF
jgi:DNA repair exonuclease SbcCD ATPase subunit